MNFLVILSLLCGTPYLMGMSVADDGDQSSSSAVASTELWPAHRRVLSSLARARHSFSEDRGEVGSSIEAQGRDRSSSSVSSVETAMVRSDTSLSESNEPVDFTSPLCPSESFNGRHPCYLKCSHLRSINLARAYLNCGRCPNDGISAVQLLLPVLVQEEHLSASILARLRLGLTYATGCEAIKRDLDLAEGYLGPLARKSTVLCPCPDPSSCISSWIRETAQYWLKNVADLRAQSQLAEVASVSAAPAPSVDNSRVTTSDLSVSTASEAANDDFSPTVRTVRASPSSSSSSRVSAPRNFHDIEINDNHFPPADPKKDQGRPSVAGVISRQ